MTTTATPLVHPSVDPTGSGPTPRRRAARSVAAGLVALGTLPYVVLKIAWLSGSTVGLVDPGMVSSASMVSLNAVTLTMDLVVIAFAVALACRAGLRLPAVAVLLPAWVAGGLLLPITVAILPATLLDGAATSGDGLAGWIRPMVYSGFAWQGVFLLLTFALYAWDRWGDVLRRPGPPLADAVSGLQRATAVGGSATALVSAGLHLLGAATGGSLAGAIVDVADAGFAIAGTLGVLALARAVTGRARTAAVVVGWLGSGAMFGWGLWLTVTTMGATDLSVAGNPVTGLAALSGLLAGFALAVAGLLALAGTRITVRS